MHLMMSGKEKERFVLRSRLLYGKCTSRNQKSAIIDDLMQYIGYKTRKYAITVLTQGQKKRHLHLPLRSFFAQNCDR